VEDDLSVGGGPGGRFAASLNPETVKMREKVQEALDSIRPFLQADGGDVELVEVKDDGVVLVRLVGACGGCPMSMMTLKAGIEQRVKEQVPEVKSVEAV
jgi:Fe-S cluster biogenesis protein NfuA